MVSINNPQALEILREIARRERRSPREQAGVLLERSLQRAAQERDPALPRKEPFD